MTTIRAVRREPLLTVPEAAQLCRLSVRQIWREIKKQRLAVVRIGRSVRIRLDDLERFIDRGCDDNASRKLSIWVNNIAKVRNTRCQ